jgi:hypothetical protein
MKGTLMGRGETGEYLVAVGLVLLLTVLLVLALRDVVREVIVIPLLYVLWMGQLLLRSVPQALFWFAFVIVAFFLALGSLVRGKSPPPEPHPVGRRFSGQVSAWAKRVRLMAAGGYTGWYFGQHVEKLIVTVLAYRERLSTGETRRRIKAGDLEVPPEVQAYFGIVLMPSRRRWPLGLLSRFRFRPRVGAQRMLPGGLERVVWFLEDQLEVGYDGRNR